MVHTVWRSYWYKLWHHIQEKPFTLSEDVDSFLQPIQPFQREEVNDDVCNPKTDSLYMSFVNSIYAIRLYLAMFLKVLIFSEKSDHDTVPVNRPAAHSQ